MGTNDKSLEYYLDLDYDLVVTRIEDEDQVAYSAHARELDANAFYGVGRTKAEAIKSFEKTRREVMTLFFEQGIAIPEPQREEEQLPSGHFIVRTSPVTHKRLVDLAKKENQSLNAFVNTVITQYVTGESIVERVVAVAEKTICAGMKDVVQSCWNVQLSSYGRPLFLNSKETGYDEAA